MFSILLIEDILNGEEHIFWDQNMFKKQYSTTTKSNDFYANQGIKIEE